MPSRFTIPVPADYLFKRDVCSYGYFLLAPNLWIPERHTLIRPIQLRSGIVTLALSQPQGRGKPIRIASDRTLTKKDRAELEPLLRRMLSLDDSDIRDFHKVDPRWKKSGRARLFRSPTFFEDLIKTVTSCNVTWPSTVSMNRRLCEVINPAFPSPAQLARKRPAMLRARCGVGYRDARIVELAKMHQSGKIEPAWFENPANSDETVFKALLALPGIGPYGAGNLMQLLGRYSRLAVDTETIRHGKSTLGMTGNERQITKALHAHYEPFGRHKFRSFWFEVWAFYESRKGPAWTWEPKTTGKSFTAALLKD